MVEPHCDTGGGNCPMSGQIASGWDEDSTRPAVRGRSGGICEFCAENRARDMHHRKSLGVGGGWHPANVLHLCRSCHRFATEHPDWAHIVGLIVMTGEDPERRPVTREDGSIFQPTDDVAPPIPKERKQRR